MLIDELAGRSVCILGYGREGKATVRALEKYADGCKAITIADRNAELEMQNEFQISNFKPAKTI